MHNIYNYAAIAIGCYIAKIGNELSIRNVFFWSAQ